MATELKSFFGDVKEFFKKNGWWLQYLVLFIIILVGAFIRMQPVDERLIDQTTGEYISIELDSTHFYRHAQDIAEKGKLEGTDMMRAVPLGQPIGFYPLYTSYFVANLWKLLHIFNSDITVEYVDVIYPVVAMIIFSLFLFLLLRRLIGWKAALLSTLFVNILPSFLFRSMGGSSDHDILGMMFIAMSFYFYFVAWDSKKLRNNILFGIIAGICTYLAMASAGSGRFILMIIGVTVLFTILLNNFKEKDLYVLLAWLVSFTLFMFIDGLSVSSLFSSLSTVPAYFVLFVGLIDFLVFKKDYLKLQDKLKKYLPSSLMSILFALILGSIFALVFFGIEIFIKDISMIYNYVFHAFQYGRVGLTVAENQRPYIVQWFSHFGTFFVFLFIIGAIILFYKAVKPISDFRRKLTAVFTIFLVLYIFSRFAPNTLLDGENAFSRFLFFGAIVMFVVYFLYIYLSSFYKKSLAYKEMISIDKRYLFLLVWFLIMVIGATTAIRFFFEFSPIAIIFASFLLAYLVEYLLGFREVIVKSIGLFIIFLILFSPFSFAKGLVVENYQMSLLQAEYSGPGYNQQWQEAGKWVRENTPSGSVFAHWWDYGYWVQSGFDRPTVTDGGHPIGWWDYLVARDVLTAQNLEQPLKFLKVHNVSYLLIVSDEIGKYPAYSSIGGDETHDRYSYLTTFVMDPMSIQETRNGTNLVYQGYFPLDEDFVYNSKVYPANSAFIGGIVLPLDNVLDENQSLVGQTIGQPTAILVYGNEQIALPMKCLYADQLYEFEDYDYGGCFRIIPVIQGNQISDFGAGVFIPRRVIDSLFARLYLFDEQSEYYRLVYNDLEFTPLSLYQGVLIGPIKIWEVNYPEGLELTEEELEYNLRIDYPNPVLDNPR